MPSRCIISKGMVTCNTLNIKFQSPRQMMKCIPTKGYLVSHHVSTFRFHITLFPGTRSTLRELPSLVLVLARYDLGGLHWYLRYCFFLVQTTSIVALFLTFPYSPACHWFGVTQLEELTFTTKISSPYFRFWLMKTLISTTRTYLHREWSSNSPPFPLSRKRYYCCKGFLICIFPHLQFSIVCIDSELCMMIELWEFW